MIKKFTIVQTDSHEEALDGMLLQWYRYYFSKVSLYFRERGTRRDKKTGRLNMTLHSLLPGELWLAIFTSKQLTGYWHIVHCSLRSEKECHVHGSISKLEHISYFCREQDEAVIVVTPVLTLTYFDAFFVYIT